MNKDQLNGHSSLQQNISDEDFELMCDMAKDDPVIVEVKYEKKKKISFNVISFQRRRARTNEITKKLGAYLLKGYCMLSDACPECDVRKSILYFKNKKNFSQCILLRTPERQLLCVGCVEVDNGQLKNNIKKTDKISANTIK